MFPGHPPTESEVPVPIEHRIDHPHRLVIAIAHGRLEGSEIFEYQRTVWSQPEVRGYDEVVDMTEVERFEVPTTERLKELVDLSAAMDPPDLPSKFAIVATDAIARELGGVFAIYREMDPRSSKEVRVFQTMGAALDWLSRPYSVA